MGNSHEIMLSMLKNVIKRKITESLRRGPLLKHVCWQIITIAFHKYFSVL